MSNQEVITLIEKQFSDCLFILTVSDGTVLTNITDLKFAIEALDITKKSFEEYFKNKKE